MTRRERDGLSAREQLIDDALHVPSGTNFERARQELAGKLVGFPNCVVGAIRLTQYTAVSEAAIARDGTIAFVGITHDRKAELRLWYPERGLVQEPVAVAMRIEHVQFPDGSLEPAYTMANLLGMQAVWGQMKTARFDRARCCCLKAWRDEAGNKCMYFGKNNQDGTFVRFSGDGIPSATEFERCVFMGVALGEPVICMLDTDPYRHVVWGKGQSKPLYGLVDGSCEYVEGRKIRFVVRDVQMGSEGKLSLVCLSETGQEFTKRLYCRDDVFYTRAGIFLASSQPKQRKVVQNVDGTFMVELQKEMTHVYQVVSDKKRLFVLGEGNNGKWERTTVFDLETGERLTEQDTTTGESCLVELEGHVLLALGKQNRFDWYRKDGGEDTSRIFPLYHSSVNIAAIDCGDLASWHFVNGTLYAIRYEQARR